MISWFTALYTEHALQFLLDCCYFNLVVTMRALIICVSKQNSLTCVLFLQCSQTWMPLHHFNQKKQSCSIGSSNNKCLCIFEAILLLFGVFILNINMLSVCFPCYKRLGFYLCLDTGCSNRNSDLIQSLKNVSLSYLLHVMRMGYLKWFSTPSLILWCL